MSWGILREGEGGSFGQRRRGAMSGSEGIGTLKGGICHALWRRVGD